MEAPLSDSPWELCLPHCLAFKHTCICQFLSSVPSSNSYKPWPRGIFPVQTGMFARSPSRAALPRCLLREFTVASWKPQWHEVLEDIWLSASTSVVVFPIQSRTHTHTHTHTHRNRHRERENCIWMIQSSDSLSVASRWPASRCISGKAPHPDNAFNHLLLFDTSVLKGDFCRVRGLNCHLMKTGFWMFVKAVLASPLWYDGLQNPGDLFVCSLRCSASSSRRFIPRIFKELLFQQAGNAERGFFSHFCTTHIILLF